MWLDESDKTLYGGVYIREEGNVILYKGQKQVDHDKALFNKATEEELTGYKGEQF